MSKKDFWFAFMIFTGIFLVAFILLTPHDYQITESLYSSGLPLSKVLEVIGPIFMPFFAIYSTVSLAIHVRFDKKVKEVFKYIGLGFVYIYAFFMGMFSLKYSYAAYLFFPSLVLYVLFTGFVVYLNLKVIKEQTISKHIRICLVMLITIGVSLLLVDIIKLFISRGRFHEILVGEANYTPWYIPTWRFVLNSSFPSGHASRAATALCFGLLFYYSKEKAFLSYVIEGVAAIFAIAVAISRLYEGMHFTTDIIAGFYLTTAGYYISKVYLLKK